MGVAIGLIVVERVIYNEFLVLAVNESLTVYEIYGKEKRSFSIKFLVRDFSFAETALPPHLSLRSHC